MIRAIYRRGIIEPLENVPADWRDGDEVTVELTETAPAADALDAWVADVEAAAAKISDEDHDKFMAAIAEHRAQAKEWMRREMGLAE